MSTSHELKYERRLISTFFDLCCDMNPNGKGWECSAWASEKNQQRLFHAVSLIGNLKEGSVLDVGCGCADFYDFLKMIPPRTCEEMGDPPIQYTGIDISPKMIQRAKEYYPEADARLLDLKDVDEEYDWVVAVGPFNVRVSQNQPEYLKDQIKRMFDLARRGLSFTFLSNRAVDKEHHFDELFYYDPADIFRYCLSLSKYVAADHMAEPTQMVVYMPKI